MSKQASKRNSRRNVMRSFRDHFDLERLDYQRRMKPRKDWAMIIGLIIAAVIYMVFFGLIMYSRSQGMIDDTMVNKVAWMLMIPTSVVGAFAYLITINRREFPIREDIRAHVRQFEGEQGYLWRYEPILQQLELKKINMDGLISASRQNLLVEMAPEDICATVQALHEVLQNNGPQASPAAISQVEESLGATADGD
jgi:hypothetical protein